MKNLSLVVAAVIVLSASTFAKGTKQAPATAPKAAPAKTEKAETKATPAKEVKKTHTPKAAVKPSSEKATK